MLHARPAMRVTQQQRPAAPAASQARRCCLRIVASQRKPRLRAVAADERLNVFLEANADANAGGAAKAAAFAPARDPLLQLSFGSGGALMDCVPITWEDPQLGYPTLLLEAAPAAQNGSDDDGDENDGEDATRVRAPRRAPPHAARAALPAARTTRAHAVPRRARAAVRPMRPEPRADVVPVTWEDAMGDGLHVVTPLVLSNALSEAAGCNVWLKLDNMQPTGSFKMRGVGAACARAVRARGATCLVASSGGNAGLAVAHAAAQLGVRALVFVPEGTTEHARRRMQVLGADVRIVGQCLDDAIEAAQAAVAADPSAAFVPPFDHPDVIDGNATAMDEALWQLQAAYSAPRAGASTSTNANGAPHVSHGQGALHSPPRAPKAVICSVGGGGLITGVLRSLARHGLGGAVRVVGVETEGAASFGAALSARRLVRLDAVRTCAMTLGARRVAGAALEAALRAPVTALAVPDRAAVEASLRFLSHTGALVEPACGAALAPVFDPALLRAALAGAGCGRAGGGAVIARSPVPVSAFNTPGGRSSGRPGRRSRDASGRSPREALWRGDDVIVMVCGGSSIGSEADLQALLAKV